jgi:hypothetical protein
LFWFKASLHESILRTAAQPALKGLAVQRLALLADEGKGLPSNLGPEAKALLEICQTLQRSGFREGDITRLAHNRVLDGYTEGFLEKLNCHCLLVLSILTWHFEASVHVPPNSSHPPRGLLQFFHREKDNLKQLCGILCDRYNNLSKQKKIPQQEFVEKLDDLLRYLEFGFGLFLLDSR